MPKRSSIADTATTIGTNKLEENDVIVFQIYLGQFKRSTYNFKNIFEEIEIFNDTKKLNNITTKLDTQVPSA